jgi:putative tricarboxylic transport membrane protein
VTSPVVSDVRAAAPEAAPREAVPGGVVARPVSWRGPRIAGLALLALCVAALVATSRIPSVRDGWAVSGPRFVPLVASVMLIVLSITFLVRTVVRPDIELARFAAAESAKTHWPTPGLVMAGLLGYLALLTPLGYALATALFFTATARVLGSSRPLRDAGSGVVLGVVVCYAFTRWLGVRLPVGPWGV